MDRQYLKSKPLTHEHCTHPATKAERGKCRMRRVETAAKIDAAHDDLMTANAAEPYVHDEYERCERILRSYIIIYASGNEQYAYALRQAFLDSGEDMLWYTSQFTARELIETFPMQTWG